MPPDARGGLAGEVYSLARKRVNLLLAKQGSSLNQVLRHGWLEPALFMVSVSARNVLFEDFVQQRNEAFLEKALSERGHDPTGIRRGGRVSFDYKDLREFVDETRAYAWGLKQVIIPSRGSILERCVGFVIEDTVQDKLSSLPGVQAEFINSSRLAKYHYVDLTVVLTKKGASRTLGYSIKGSTRDRVPQSAKRNEEALEQHTHDAMAHIFLADGDTADDAALRGMDTEKDGRVYTWSRTAKLIGKPGVVPISTLPRDILVEASRLTA